MRKLKSAKTTARITTTSKPTNASADPTAASAPRTAHATSEMTIAKLEMDVPTKNRYQSSSQFCAQLMGNKKISSKVSPPTSESPALKRRRREAGCKSFESIEDIVMANETS